MFLNFHRGKLTDKIQQALCFKRAFLLSRRKE
nr:MAG TPA: hypothetical protein [Caudoviricetes sp.]